MSQQSNKKAYQSQTAAKNGAHIKQQNPVIRNHCKSNTIIRNVLKFLLGVGSEDLVPVGGEGRQAIQELKIVLKAASTC